MKRIDPDFKIEAYDQAINYLRVLEDITELNPDRKAEQERAFAWLADKLEKELNRWLVNTAPKKEIE